MAIDSWCRINWTLSLLVALAISIAYGGDAEEDGVIRNRHPITVPCEIKFDSVDYSSVTSVCKAPEYDLKQCCDAFTAMACKYPKHVNDYRTTCPIEFVSFLNLAGSYPHGIFVGRCNKDGQHLLCPA